MHRVLVLSLLLLPLLLPNVSVAREPDAAPGSATTGAMPPPPAWLHELEALYDARIRVAGLEDRAFSPEHWWDVAGPLVIEARGFRTEEVGRSAEGRPLRHVSWGQGDKCVLLWSQMHGDESTASMAIVDLFRFLGDHPDHPLVQRLQQGTTLHFLPVMNPDGAARFQRRNAQGVDVNRDARALATPEARALHGLREQLAPDFGFNLHDQDVGTRAGDSDNGTAIALLAPAYNEAREVNATRARAIEVAVAIRAVLEPYINGHIAKWDDTFNPRAFGDLTAAAGVSTILIESGGIEGAAEAAPAQTQLPGTGRRTGRHRHRRTRGPAPSPLRGTARKRQDLARPADYGRHTRHSRPTAGQGGLGGGVRTSATRTRWHHRRYRRPARHTRTPHDRRHRPVHRAVRPARRQHGPEAQGLRPWPLSISVPATRR